MTPHAGGSAPGTPAPAQHASASQAGRERALREHSLGEVASVPRRLARREALERELRVPTVHSRHGERRPAPPPLKYPRAHARRVPDANPKQSRLSEPGAVPAALLALAASAGKVVEVGAGARFDVALALKAANVAGEVIVTDVSPAVLQAPRDLAAFVDDVTRPSWPLYEGAGLVYGVRLPEELQLPTARVARRVGAAFAVRPLKDELADVREVFRRGESLGGGWWLHR